MCRRLVVIVAPLLSVLGCASTERGSADRVSHSARDAIETRSADWTYRSSIRPLHGPDAALRHRLHVIARRVMPAVVYVTTVPRRPAASNGTGRVRTTSSRYGGTGVILNDKGAVLTSAHVVEDASAAVVTLADGSSHAVHRIILDPKYDLALLYTGATGLRPLTPAVQGAVPGSEVVAMCGPKSGYRRRIRDRARLGVVEGVSQSLQNQGTSLGMRDYRNLIRTTTTLEPGFSGGPLLDAGGHLVGMNVAAVRGNRTRGPRGYALPFNEHTLKSINCLLSGTNAKQWRIPAPTKPEAPSRTAARIRP